MPKPTTTESGALFAEERHRAVLERLRSSGKVTVDELAETFRVSAATVRADLSRLEQNGLLQRTHGGAIRADGTVFEPPYDQRQVLHLAEKKAIARAAAATVKDGDTILLDAGTTTHEIALAVRQRGPLTVVTNSLATASVLMDCHEIELILIGGEVQSRRRATLGPLAARFLDRFHVDRAFMAFNGISAVTGLTVVDFDAAEVKRRMMAAASRTVVVADASKIGRAGFAVVGPITLAHQVITDPGVLPLDADAIRELGVEVEVAPL